MHTPPPGLTVTSTTSSKDVNLDGSKIPNLDQAQQHLEQEGIMGHKQLSCKTRNKKTNDKLGNSVIDCFKVIVEDSLKRDSSKALNQELYRR